MLMEDFETRLRNLTKECDKERLELAQQRGRYDELRKMLREEKANLEMHEEEQALLEQTKSFLANVLHSTETDIEDLFSGIGTAAVQSVFDEGKKLQFKFVPTSTGVNVKISVLKPSPDGDGFIEIDPDYEGGGVIDIVSLALRIAMLELHSDRPTGPLILDESIKFLADDDAVQGVGQFLKTISEETQRQILIVTHKSKLSSFADRSFIFSRGKNDTVVVRSFGEDDDEEEQQSE